MMRYVINFVNMSMILDDKKGTSDYLFLADCELLNDRWSSDITLMPSIICAQARGGGFVYISNEDILVW